MAIDFVPRICGDNSVHVPQQGCNDCEKLEKRVKDLEDTRLVQSDIKAGEHITVNYAPDNNQVTIEADLSNYYTQTEVNNLISAISDFHIAVVDELPQSGEARTIYLVPKPAGYENNIRNEYIWVNGDWELIGDTAVDLSNYYNKTEIDNMLNGMQALTKTNILNAIDYKETTISMTDINNNVFTKNVLVKK